MNNSPEFGWLFLLKYATWLYENYPEKFIETFGPLSKIQIEQVKRPQMISINYCCTDGGQNDD